MDITIWHVVGAPLMAAVGFYGVLWRTWLAPMRREREDLIRWRKDQEAKDQAHETRMALIEQRLDKGEEKFTEIMRKLDGLKDGQHELKLEIQAHRKACEKS